MKIQLARVSRSRKGHPIRALSIVEAESPSIGRGAQCAIHLSDPRVAFEHASVFGSGAAPHVASVGGAMLMVDGRSAGDIVLAPGSRFEIGPYAFAVETPPAGCDLALAVELVRPLPDTLSEIVKNSRFSLAESGASKRRAAWIALAVVLVLFILVPVVNPTIPLTIKTVHDGKGTAERQISPDAVWNPGPLASKHEKDSYNCGACHQTPFVRVKDVACLHCHEKVAGHVDDPRLQKTLFGDTRCAECHIDHRGGERPIRADADLCSSCHANIKGVHAQTAQENASDFAKDHPEFRLTLFKGPKVEDVVRVKQSDKAQLVERSNLKFPHDVHLKPGVRGPDGRENLTCGSCHAPDVSERGFVPVNMNRHCVRCHEMRFEPDVKSRQVPHGSVEEAWLLIQEFYAKISLQNVPVDTIDTGDVRRTIPMASDAIVTDDQRRRALAFARVKAQRVAVDLFEKRVCIVCHDVRRTSSEPPTEGTAVPWEVPPVHVSNSWMPKAQFDHARHRTEKADCKDCHDVARSKRSSDVAMPDIATCRNCHSGNEAVPGKLVSTCISCHGYHLAGHAARADLSTPAVPNGVTKQ